MPDLACDGSIWKATPEWHLRVSDPLPTPSPHDICDQPTVVGFQLIELQLPCHIRQDF